MSPDFLKGLRARGRENPLRLYIWTLFSERKFTEILIWTFFSKRKFIDISIWTFFSGSKEQNMILTLKKKERIFCQAGEKYSESGRSPPSPQSRSCSGY